MSFGLNFSTKAEIAFAGLPISARRPGEPGRGERYSDVILRLAKG
jgi:hypothetical protein